MTSLREIREYDFLLGEELDPAYYGSERGFSYSFSLHYDRVQSMWGLGLEKLNALPDSFTQLFSWYTGSGTPTPAPTPTPTPTQPPSGGNDRIDKLVELERIDGELKIFGPHSKAINGLVLNLCSSLAISLIFQSRGLNVNDPSVRSTRDQMFDICVSDMPDRINRLRSTMPDYPNGTQMYQDYLASLDTLVSSLKSALHTFRNGKYSNNFASVEKEFSDNIKTALATWEGELSRIVDAYGKRVDELAKP